MESITAALQASIKAGAAEAEVWDLQNAENAAAFRLAALKTDVARLFNDYTNDVFAVFGTLAARCVRILLLLAGPAQLSRAAACAQHPHPWLLPPALRRSGHCRASSGWGSFCAAAR